MERTTTTDPVSIATGLLLSYVAAADRDTVVATAHAELTKLLDSSAVWVPGTVSPDMVGANAYGTSLPRYRPATGVTTTEQRAVDIAWSDLVADSPNNDERRFLRLRVDSPEDVRRLRALGDLGGLVVVPSLDSAGSHRGFSWRWPFRVGVLGSQEWVAAVQSGPHHGTVFHAEKFDAAAGYEIVLVEAGDRTGATVDQLQAVDRTCVIVAGDLPVEQLLDDLQRRLAPTIAVAFSGPPSAWWSPFFHELSHDAPLDAAVELACRWSGVDALVAAPQWGLDITAPARWFAAVAQDTPDPARMVDLLEAWTWDQEGEGSTRASREADDLRAQGVDLTAVIPAITSSAEPPEPTEPEMAEPEAAEPETAEPETAEPETAEPETAEPETAGDEAEEVEPTAEGRGPRRLVTRVKDGDQLVTSVLPPERDLSLRVRVAVPEQDDTVADGLAVRLPVTDAATVTLDVVVRSDVWKKQPPPQQAVISTQKTDQPSTWAIFPFTTAGDGSVVVIEIVLLYQGKALQAATYVAPVRRKAAEADEKPTLTVHNLSGPDEPTPELRPVEAQLDGTGAELVRVDGVGRPVLITRVQDMLDTVEEQVSRVLVRQGETDSFDDPETLKLLITLARVGVELRELLAPLKIAEAASINVMVADTTPVLPLELVYAGPTPREKGVRICAHLDTPPAPGEVCTEAGERVVCPYLFWGLLTSISRTVVWDGDPKPAPKRTRASAVSVLFASTVIADRDADAPLPSDRVLEAARSAFTTVTRVSSWSAWRTEIKRKKPRLLVVLGHTAIEGTETRLFIGKNSALARADISADDLLVTGGRAPLVLLIACSTAALGDVFGTLPGALTRKGAGAVVGTLARITGPQGAAATMHLLRAVHEASDDHASVGDVVAAARRSLLAEKHPVGLILVSHGETDTTVVG